MFDVAFNLADFERRTKEIGAQIDQLPFALSQAMNNAAFATRDVLVKQTWPQHVTVRKSNFLSAALRVEKADKHNLYVAITNAGIPDRGHLPLHDKGGIKVSRGRLAIPQKDRIVRTARGVRADQRPRALIANTPRRALRITPKGIFIGKGGRLNLWYIFKPSAAIKPTVPLSADFKLSMQVFMREAFPLAMAKAMSTRK